MLRSFLMPASVLVGILALGCNDQPLPSDLGTPLSPSFRTENNPDGPGAFVGRGEGGFFFADIIPNTEFSYLMAITLEEFAKLCANEEFLASPFSDQQVLRPDESIHDLFRAKHLPLAAWNTGTHPRDFCSVPPFAVGTAQMIRRDTDLSFSANRADAFGFIIHGTARALEGGQLYHLWQRLRGTALKTGELHVFSEEFRFFPAGH